VISGQAFTNFYGIDTATSRRFPARVEDGVLCIDLKTEGTVVTSNRLGSGQRAENGQGTLGEQFKGTGTEVLQ